MSENDASKKLTPTQEKAITALLSCPTLEAAARSCGVSVATLRRWRQESAFREAFREARMALLESSTMALRGAAGDAVNTLVELLSCASPSVRARAAELILTNAYRAAEVEDISERLETLEKTIAERDR